MSMATLTLWQLTGTFCAYLFVTVGLPAFVFGKRLRGHRAPERFMIYFMTGNFFVVNLVYALQLIKISHPVTLILGTFLTAIITWVKVNHIPVKEISLNHTKKLRRLAGGQMGIKTAVYEIGAWLRSALYRFCRWAGYYLFHRFLDCVLIVLLVAALWYIYGTNLVEYFGYKASDVLVHNYWINSLGDNDIFVSGVYPYGFHCIIYYLHAVFRLDTFVLLRVFAFVENVLIHLMLLCVLRLCCRSRYAAYVGTFAFVIGTFFYGDTYARFNAALPQEFGMIFIFPAVYFGFAFFETRWHEVKTEKEKLSADFMEAEAPETAKRIKKKRNNACSRSSLCLAGFCMSFSMTLTVHFYGTVIAGLFCLAMACGYCFLFIRKQYFGKVVLTVVLSVAISVFPMALAYIGGTHLEGSLLWAMSVIQSKDDSAEKTVVDDSPEQNAAVGEFVPGDSAAGDFSGSEDSASGEAFTGAVGGEMPVQKQKVQIDIAERVSQIQNKIEHIWNVIGGSLQANVFELPYGDGVRWVMISFFGLIGLGCFYILVRRVCYGAMLVSTGLYMLFMCVLVGASVLGLPTLMDRGRASIYFAYSCPVALAFLLDGVLYIPFIWLRGKVWKVGSVFLNGLSFACLGVLLYYAVATEQVKTPLQTEGQEMNEAVVCLTNIIRNEDDFSWTIVSANDESRMGWDHGYHYETLTFLNEMERAPTDTLIRIPTKVVYIFVEKIPIDYNLPYVDSGQSISEVGASYILPGNGGTYSYQGFSRWVLMSRLYYWAETFQKYFPNEMDVYMETDSFICYRVEQEPYRLFNFALDYGYNHWGNTVVKTAD